MNTVSSEEVFEAVRRGYGELAEASDQEILEHFSAVDAESVQGHLNNVKGILFEEEYLDELHGEGVDAELFEATNHPVSDIGILGDDGEVLHELQLKATDNAHYISETLETLPEEVDLVATTEVADAFGEEVIDSGISDTLLEEAVGEVLFPVSPVSVIGWFFGIF